MTPKRIAAIDWMRGLVMVFMAIDHASAFFNEGRTAADSALFYEAGSALPPDQFFTRWITHLCAPTFVFLAGTSIAVSTAGRRARGMTDWAIDRDLLIRGAFIASLDLLFMSALESFYILQVLYAIGVSMMLMVPLRRLGSRTLLGIALALMVGGEAVTMLIWNPASHTPPPLWVGLTLAPQMREGLVIIYPAIPWLSIMMLGWVLGERVASPKPDGWSVERVLATWGLGALLCFAVVRGLDGYGNMGLHREDGSIVQWLHVSKYPPAIAFITLELGLMALCLAGLMRLEPRLPARRNGLLLVLGQTALFFYLAHFSLLGAASAFLPEGGLGQTYLVAACLVVVLYPVCIGFRALKQRYPTSVLRFV